ncbi:MAG TPA: hypothetical protein VGL89_03670 [Candidatus Koribacter sp.]
MVHFAIAAPAIAGIIVFLTGIYLLFRNTTSLSSGEIRLAIATLFIAPPLATFGMEHLVIPKIIEQIVPAWLPARLFITYVVGVALIASSLSLISKKLLRLSTLLLGVMFLLFVLLMHIPAAVHEPHNRLGWLLVFRDSTFAFGGFALYRCASGRDDSPLWLELIRVWAGLAITFFGVQHMLHPECSPGVPSPRITPAWVPAPLLLSYVVGSVLIACGVAMLIRKRAVEAATITGHLMVFLTVCLYLPDALLPRSLASLVGTNYVFDTLLYGGMLLAIAKAISTPARKVPVEVLAPVSSSAAGVE